MLFLAGFTVPSVLFLHLSSRVGGIETLRRPAVAQNQRIRLSVISTVIFCGFMHLFIVWHTCCHAVSEHLNSSAIRKFLYGVCMKSCAFSVSPPAETECAIIFG